MKISSNYVRILLSKESKLDLLDYLKIFNKVNTNKELSKKLNCSKRALENWFYFEDRYMPEEIIPNKIRNNLKILDKQEDNWGAIKGGRKAYRKVIEKYGEEEMKKRRTNAIKMSKIAILKNQREFEIDLTNNLFLEFYGVLLGDGWLTVLKSQDKKFYTIGVSGDKRYDKEFYDYLKTNIRNLFDRGAYIRERRDNNSIELKFSHKMLIKYLNKKLDFPVGIKSNLEIHPEVHSLGFDKIKYVIKGIFDTDGSFYLDKDPAGRPYPCISIEMKEPKLIKQLYKLLINEGFKVSHRLGKGDRVNIDRITLKGRIQLGKWMKDIGSSNSRHLNKIHAFVTQPG